MNLKNILCSYETFELIYMVVFDRCEGLFKLYQQEDFRLDGSVVYQSKDYFKVFNIFEKEIEKRNDQLKEDIHYYQMDDIEMIHIDKDIQGLNSIAINESISINESSQNRDEIKDYEEKVLIKELKHELKWYMKKLEQISFETDYPRERMAWFLLCEHLKEQFTKILNCSVKEEFQEIDLYDLFNLRRYKQLFNYFQEKDVSPGEIEYYIQELIWDYDDEK